MKLILAQGNPESKYDRTRHNVGFFLIDTYASAHDMSWTDKSKFQARIAEGVIDGVKVMLVKPTTFYNETGVSARKISDFYSLDPRQDIVVIHDDLALPLGTIRTRGQGSDAGNNGIKSLNNHLGAAYHRIRVGIWTELRGKVSDVDFVLGTFSLDESEVIMSIQPAVHDAIDQFIAGTLEHHTQVIDAK
jgi:peptidyl-tRNA hydrolase, PTH1 family